MGTGFPVMDVGKFVGLGWLGGAKETGLGSACGRYDGIVGLFSTKSVIFEDEKDCDLTEDEDCTEDC